MTKQQIFLKIKIFLNFLLSTFFSSAVYVRNLHMLALWRYILEHVDPQEYTRCQRLNNQEHKKEHPFYKKK